MLMPDKGFPNSGADSNDDADSVARNGSWAFVLLHGGQHDGRCWRHVQQLLCATSVAPDFPHRSASGSATPPMSEAVETICNYIDVLEAENVILAGHSMAGLVMPTIERRSPKVRHSVYVAAAAPRPGPATTLASYLAKEFPWYRLERQIIAIWRLFNPNKTLNLFTGRRGLRWLTYLVLTLPRSVDAQRRELLQTLGPEPNWRIDIDTDSSSNGVDADSTTGEKRTYIAAGRDRVVRSDMVARAIKRFGPNIALRTLPSAGHGLMITHPSEVAAILNEILEAERTAQAQSN
jgi:pimeloyl-ACP methyl ester carboxylesterase